MTYFLNGGEEREWEGETRIFVPSPRDVPSYDLKPGMSAAEVAQRVCDELADGYAFCVVNFANPDMVGHTGSIPAVVGAVEAADHALGRVVECTQAAGGVCSVTADHGNAEVMLEPDGVSRRRLTRRIACRSCSPTSAPRSARKASFRTSRRRS